MLFRVYQIDSILWVEKKEGILQQYSSEWHSMEMPILMYHEIRARPQVTYFSFWLSIHCFDVIDFGFKMLFRIIETTQKLNESKHC